MCMFQDAYKKAVTLDEWKKKLEFPTGETVILHNPKVETAVIILHNNSLHEKAPSVSISVSEILPKKNNILIMNVLRAWSRLILLIL